MTATAVGDGFHRGQLNGVGQNFGLELWSTVQIARTPSDAKRDLTLVRSARWAACSRTAGQGYDSAVMARSGGQAKADPIHTANATDLGLNYTQSWIGRQHELLSIGSAITNVASLTAFVVVGRVELQVGLLSAGLGPPSPSVLRSAVRAMLARATTPPHDQQGAIDRTGPASAHAAAADVSVFAGHYAGPTGGSGEAVINSDGSGKFSIPDLVACPSCSDASAPPEKFDFKLTALRPERRVVVKVDGGGVTQISPGYRAKGVITAESDLKDAAASKIGPIGTGITATLAEGCLGLSLDTVALTRFNAPRPCDFVVSSQPPRPAEPSEPCDVHSLEAGIEWNGHGRDFFRWRRWLHRCFGSFGSHIRDRHRWRFQGRPGGYLRRGDSCRWGGHGSGRGRDTHDRGRAGAGCGLWLRR